mgnify:FL=1
MPQNKSKQPHAKQSLRVWIRMLRATTLIEKRIRSYLKSDFDSTLPRFDVLAALSREQVPVTMSELTAHLLVSNGNVTGLVNRLVDDGLIAREVDPEDRRSQLVVLTPAGRSAFEDMAAAHEGLVDSFFAQLSDEEMEALLSLTEKLNRTLHRQDDTA